MVVQVGTGERLHYLDWGVPTTPAPTLLLLHGITSTAWSWAPVARRLCGASPGARARPARARAVGGCSERAGPGVTRVGRADGARRERRGHEVGGPPAVIAGHGMGAMVAATAAVSSPRRSRGSPSWTAAGRTSGVSTRLSPAGIPRGHRGAARGDGLDGCVPGGPARLRSGRWDADQERAFRAQVDQKHAGHVGLVTRQATIRGVVEAMFDYRPVETLAAAPVPLLVMVAGAGTADDDTTLERELALDDVLAARRAAGLPEARVMRAARDRSQPDALSTGRGQRRTAGAQQRRAR